MDKKPKKKSWLMFSIENWFADVRLFFRHGLKRRFKWLKYSQTSLLKESSDWWKTRDNRRKFAKIERKQQTGRLKQEASIELKGFGQNFVSMLTSPVRFFKWGCWKLNELRQMSLREAAGEVWRGYRGLVAELLNRIEFTYFRVLDFPWWLRGLTVLTLLAGVVGAVSLPWVIDYAREVRSETMLTQARALEQDNRMVEAYQKGRTAALLQPDNVEAREYVMELAEEIRTPAAVWWSERMAKADYYDAESVAKVIELASKFGQSKTAMQYLGMLKDDYPDDPLVMESELRVLMTRGMRIDAIGKAREAYKNGNDSEMLHMILSEHFLSASDPVTRAELVEYLPANLYRDDVVGLNMMRLVLWHADTLDANIVDLVDFDKLVAEMKKHPDAEPEDRALAIGRGLEMGQLSRPEALEAFVQEYDLEDATEREKALELARAFGLYEVADKAPPAAKKEFAALRLEGLILGEGADATAALALLDEAKQAGLTPLQESFGRALLAYQGGDADAYGRHMQQTLDYAEGADWSQLAQVANKVLGKSELLAFYQDSIRRWPDNPIIAARSIAYVYSVGADKELEIMAQELPLAAFKRDPYSELFLIYLKALHRRDLPTCRYHAEELVSKYPREAMYYIGLAFVYAQSGDPALAASLLSSIPRGLDYDTLPPFLRLSLAEAGRLEAIEGLEFTLAKEKSLAGVTKPGDA